ncbi:hypothetical protein KJ742_03435 [Patescibacteria group bacterium]|nr:hypothetical protein [Patescibacteria group bacterium]MBU1682973.1 hypothetical protein [Patescibacteria group bacterium]MBU1935203.1 hypothetical protein [Patescibacteria group bacterium]
MTIAIILGVLYFQITNAICLDSDHGKNIFKKGIARTIALKDVADAGVIHLSGDTCAIKDEKASGGYVIGHSSCAGDDCYVFESYCKEHGEWGHKIDTQEPIQCPNGCNDGACIPE